MSKKKKLILDAWQRGIDHGIKSEWPQEKIKFLKRMLNNSK